MHDCVVFADAIVDLVLQSGVCRAILPPGDSPVSVFIARFSYVSEFLYYKSLLTEPSQDFCQSLEKILASLSRTTYLIFDTVSHKYSHFKVQPRGTRSEPLQPPTPPPVPGRDDYALCFCVVQELFVLLSPLSPEATDNEVLNGLGYEEDKRAVLEKRRSAAARDTDGDIPVRPKAPRPRQLLAGDPDLAEFYWNPKERPYVFCQVQFHLRADLKTVEWLAFDVEKTGTNGPAEAEAERRPLPDAEVAGESPEEEPEGSDSSDAIGDGAEAKVDA
jgi:hypothetical protein